MRWIGSACILLLAVIHLLPLSGVLGAARLQTLYGIGIESPELAILMRHRAVLFGLIGMALLASLFKPALQDAALIAAAVSVVSFLVIALTTGGYNSAIARVVAVDGLALAALGVAAAVRLFSDGSR